ncbi:hypothetical protein AB4076_11625 [Dyella sp. 2RAF44]|uniref:hypothetical protein n=1 Tax=Dyella sp. 2RAF44 TaxID=3233000 RepID=UPI003F8FB49E
MSFAPLPSVAGVEIEDMPTLDAIERAHSYLDQAEESFREGSRAGGMFLLGKAAHLLEALGAGEGEA